MKQREISLGVDVIVGMKMNYEILGADTGMLMVTRSRTVVRLR